MKRCSGVSRPVLPYEDGPALLRTEGLTKQYGRQTALDRVSFFAAPGEVLGLIGPNGSGKTTLLETCLRPLPVFCLRTLVGSSGRARSCLRDAGARLCSIFQTVFAPIRTSRSPVCCRSLPPFINDHQKRVLG